MTAPGGASECLGISNRSDILVRRNEYNNEKVMKYIFVTIIWVLTISVSAAIPVETVKQEKVRPNYPFPTFLSTSPYIWYKDVQNVPIKGHAFRISTFSEQQQYKIFIEKIEFGDGGCCREIIEFRELLLDENFLNQHFPANAGKHGFKLIRWISPETLEFEAYGGKYKLSDIGNTQPTIEELTDK